MSGFERVGRGSEQVQRRADAGGAGVAPGRQTLVEQQADPERVHAAAARGVSGPSARLPFFEQIQRSFGRHDVGGVQAHAGGAAAEGAGAMGAQAYAMGDRVAFGRTPDLHTAAHEAAHVVQQRGGVQLKGGVGQAGDPYERHADAVADTVVRGDSAEGLLDSMAPSGARGGAAVQRMVVYTDDVENVDKIIAGDIAKQHAFAGGALVSLAQLEQAQQDEIAIEPGEAVVISGHGAPGEIQDLPAQAIADLLAKIKNIRTARVIFLSACNTSTDKDNAPHSSVVDITHQTLGKLVPVVGSPGVKINDHTNVTGDGLTYYLPATSDSASDIEALVTHYMRQHDIGKEMKLDSLDKALEVGKQLLKDVAFLKFYDTLLRVLGNFDREMLVTLSHACDAVLQLDKDLDPAGWPDWLRGWHQSAPGDPKHFLARRKVQLQKVRTTLGQMHDDEQITLIARQDRGNHSLTGLPKGDGPMTGVPFNGYVNDK